jgi:hypothetical protein
VLSKSRIASKTLKVPSALISKSERGSTTNVVHGDLRRKVQHQTNITMLAKHVPHPLRVADVGDDNLHRTLRSQPIQILQGTRAAEIVKHEHFVTLLDKAAGSITTNEAQSASDKNLHTFSL